MPIDLADYSPSIKRFLNERGLACVYVLAHQGGAPSKIGHALDIAARVAAIQSANPAEIETHHLLWTPGKSVAVVIEETVQRELSARHLRGEWFDIPARDAAQAVTDAAKRLYPNAVLVPHEMIIDQLRGAKTARVTT